MRQVNVHEAKTQLSRILDDVASGIEVVIAKSGKPVAKLVPISKPKRRFGVLSGELTVPVDFDRPLPKDVLDTFES